MRSPKLHPTNSNQGGFKSSNAVIPLPAQPHQPPQNAFNFIQQIRHSVAVAQQALQFDVTASAAAVQGTGHQEEEEPMEEDVGELAESSSSPSPQTPMSSTTPHSTPTPTSTNAAVNNTN